MAIEILILLNMAMEIVIYNIYSWFTYESW